MYSNEAYRWGGGRHTYKIHRFWGFAKGNQIRGKASVFDLGPNSTVQAQLHDFWGIEIKSVTRT